MKRKIVLVALVCGFLGSSYANSQGYDDDFDRALETSDQDLGRFRSRGNRFAQSPAPAPAHSTMRQPAYEEEVPQDSMFYGDDEMAEPMPQYEAPVRRPQAQRPQRPALPADEDDYVVNDRTGKKMYLSELRSQANQRPQSARASSPRKSYAQEMPETPVGSARRARSEETQSRPYRQTSVDPFQQEIADEEGSEPEEYYPPARSAYGPQRREPSYSEGYAHKAMGREPMPMEAAAIEKAQNQAKSKTQRSSGSRVSLNPFRFIQKLNPFR